MSSALEVFYDDALYKSTLSIYLSVYLSPADCEFGTGRADIGTTGQMPGQWEEHVKHNADVADMGDKNREN